MKQFLLALLILSAGFMKSQCTLTSSVTPPSCPGNCDGSVVLTLTGCSAFPYNLSVNGGSCTPITATSFTAPVMTFTGLCSCTSGLYSAILTSSLMIPVAFTNFSVFGGVAVTNALFMNSPASCSACCTGSVSTITAGGTGPYTYTWSPSGGSTGTITSACPGVYTLCVADSKGCTVCNTYTVGFSTGVVENEITPVKVMYSKEEIVIVDVMPINTITIYDLTGRLVFKSENGNQKEIHLNKNQFNKGIYVMSIEGDRRLSKHKIIVE